MKTAAVIAGFVLAMGIAGRLDEKSASAEKWDTCNAPCVVKFPQPMHEDEFEINYVGDGTLEVWKESPNSK